MESMKMMKREERRKTDFLRSSRGKESLWLFQIQIFSLSCSIEWRKLDSTLSSSSVLSKQLSKFERKFSSEKFSRVSFSDFPATFPIAFSKSSEIHMMGRNREESDSLSSWVSIVDGSRYSHWSHILVSKQHPSSSRGYEKLKG